MPQPFNKAVLLVEDEVIIAMSQAMQLEQYGYSVEKCHSGEQALELLFEQMVPVDLVLMDIDLGQGLDGTETADLILQRRDIPIVFLSSHTEPDIVEKTEKITSYGYVVKNSGMVVLDASIKMAFKLFESHTREKQQEQALIDSEKKYRLIAENTSDGIVVFEKGIITYASEAYIRLFGYSLEDELGLDGKQIKSRIHSDDREDVYKKIYAAIRAKENNLVYQYRFLHARGHYLWREDSTRMIFDEDGTMTKAYVIARDITETKTAELRQARQLLFSQALNRISEHILQDTNQEDLLENVNREIVQALNIDRIRIYRVSFPDDRITALCEWLGNNDSLVEPTKGQYNSLEMFNKAFTHILRTGSYIESHQNDINPLFTDSPAAALLHQMLNIKSLLWFPFAFTETGYHLFTINSILTERQWQTDELDFLDTLARQVNIALLKIIMIEEQTAARSALTHEKQLFQKITETSPVGIIIVNANEEITFANPEAERVLGLSHQEITSSAYNAQAWQATDLDGNPLSDERLPFFLVKNNTSTVRGIRHGIEYPDGRHMIVSVSASPLFNAHDEFDGMVATFEDITERVTVEKQLVLTQRRLVNSMKMARLTSWEYDTTADEFIFNDEFYELYSTTAEREGGYRLKSIDYVQRIVHPDDIPAIAEAMQKAALYDDGSMHYIEHRIICRDGSVKTIGVCYFSIVDANNKPLYRYGANQDITERVESHEMIRNLLAEKELMLKETHHRIKNNLGSVSSLLTLEASHHDDSPAAVILRESAARVRSMGLLYDKLNRGPQSGTLKVQDYLVDIVRDTMSLYPLSTKVTFHYTACSCELPTQTTSVLGIIICELVTNTLKYAFPEHGKGTITLEAHASDNELVIEYSDDGTGFSGNSSKPSSGFGLNLITMLARQIKATLSSSTDNGVHYSISLPIKSENHC